MQKMVSILLILSILVSLTVPVLAGSTEIKVYVDQVLINFPDQKPFINSDNRTLVPARFVSEALGAKVDWDAAARQVTVNYENKKIVLIIGSGTARVNDKLVHLDTTATLVNNRTMVPLRFVSECLGAKVDWDQAKRAVYITTKNNLHALVDSDLFLEVRPNGNLSMLVLYEWTTPVEPQLEDLQEILIKRLGDKAQEIVDYVATKKGNHPRIDEKEWMINGWNISVHDSVGSVSVQVWR